MKGAMEQGRALSLRSYGFCLPCQIGFGSSGSPSLDFFSRLHKGFSFENLQ